MDGNLVSRPPVWLTAGPLMLEVAQAHCMRPDCLHLQRPLKNKQGRVGVDEPQDDANKLCGRT